VPVHLRKEEFSGHGLENERQESLAYVDLASAYHDPDSGKTLQMEVVSLKPGLGRSNVAADRRPRGAELFLEVAYVYRARRSIEQGCQNLELAVVATQDPWPRGRAETREDRTAALRIP